MAENRNKTAELGTFWIDGAEGNTPLSAENLNARELKMAEEFKNNDEYAPLVHFKINSTVYTCKKGTKWQDLQNTLLADLGLTIQDGNVCNLKNNASMFLFNDAFSSSNLVNANHYIMDYRDNNNYSINLS